MPDNVRELLEKLAVPRMTGTQGASESEAQLQSQLVELGYDVRDLSFSFSAIPGRYGVSIVGALYLIFTLGAISLLRERAGAAALDL